MEEIKSKEIKVTYQLEREYLLYNKKLAKEHYLSYMDGVIETLINAENILWNDNVNEYYLIEDFHDVTAEAVKKVKAERLIKFKPLTIEAFIELKEHGML